ncbi:MAG: tetratricopeptide repeat protein [Muribaculaceae bacterium]|nr:tetratricopeptide repeat protein [Muribaculaceae bacterium]
MKLFCWHIYRYSIILFAIIAPFMAGAQINTDQVMKIGRNTLYFEDYLLSIQYFNQVISVKPYLAQPYFYRAVAKLNLEDYAGAFNDATLAIERNPFITDAYEVRGVAAQNMGQFENAILDYDHALEMLPDNRGIMFNKAIAQQELKDFDGAKETLEKIIEHNPSFDNAYLGRAKLNIALGDTTNALNDIARAIDINKNSINAYVMRADIAIARDSCLEGALLDMNEAIRLQPHFAGFFINRAFLRYRLDDYFGAMADYDYAIQLEPANTTAIFNRGLLRAETRDDNKAIDDFSTVLKINPNDYKALYNRATLYRQIGNINAAISDLNRVIDAFPDFAAAYFLRFDCKRIIGDRSAERDYRKSIDLAKTRVRRSPLDGSPYAINHADDNNLDQSNSDSQEEISRRFTSLNTINDNTTPTQEYNSKEIRGKIQDNNVTVSIEPVFVLTFYDDPTELKPGGDYIREVDEINSTHTLRSPLRVTNHEPAMTDDETTRRHFQSVEYYNSYIASHTPRTIDYFGRAMDLITLRDYAAAILDLDRCTVSSPNFALAYFTRAMARYKLAMLPGSTSLSPGDNSNTQLHLDDHRASMRAIIDDLDTTIKISPDMAVAHYNKGVILLENDDLTGAIAAFSKAIEIKPDFGEAFYNRGYVYFRLGNRDAGAADLSKAGELGIIPSYNLLKRMSR